MLPAKISSRKTAYPLPGGAAVLLSSNLFKLKIENFWSLYPTQREGPCGTIAEPLVLNTSSKKTGMTKSIYKEWDKELNVEQFKMSENLN